MDKKIVKFIDKHFVLTLATVVDNSAHVSSIFYAFCPETNSFIFSSDHQTKHIQDITSNNSVGISIVLETKVVGKIQGLQAKAKVHRVDADDKHSSGVYFKRFPFALAMETTLWRAELTYAKLTDNRLGFGKKLIWESQNDK